MRRFLAAFVLLLSWFSASAQTGSVHKTGDSLLQEFFVRFDITAAAEQAELRLRRAPADPEALFIRMETAELQERPELVLDSALRLCRLPAAADLQEVASNRVLQHAANTAVFNAFLHRVKSAALLSNGCTFNLRLALVAAASDGASALDPDQTARFAGLITHWRMAGPFGRFNNVDFERAWPPESDQLAKSQYPMEPPSGTDSPARKNTAAPTISTERFWFRNGMIALPEYFSLPGVFYSAGDVEVAAKQASQLEVLSSGSYAVFVDGKPVLLHDARYQAGASRDSAKLVLAAGHHHVMVKFTEDATPLSVSLHPQFPSVQKASPIQQRLAEYARQLSAYFHGDFIAFEQMLSAAGNSPALTNYLRALLYSAAEDHSPRADGAWKTVAEARPAALLARLKCDESAIEHGHGDEVQQDVLRVLDERPQSETALRLAFHLSHNKQAEAPAILERLLKAHASCAQLMQAVKFHGSTAEQDRALEAEKQLATCAPESLQYARVLSDSGRHSAAAAYLQQIVGRNPLHRAARRLLVEQLVLENQLSAAKLQAAQLKEIAPNARSYARLAADPRMAQDSKSWRANGFATGAAFYLPYRRDGLEMVRKTAQRVFSGGSAVLLLSDKTVELRRDGSASVYVHRITRPLNKDGISRYGEIALPPGADLLELRTIKSSGEIIEPELAQQKPTISMPALEPGDAIEEEFVMHFAELGLAPESVTSFTFGSFSAPILYARLVVLSPEDSKPAVREWSGPPQSLVGENNGTVIRIWDRENIAQTVAEPFLPNSSLLPTVTVANDEKTRDRLRDELIDATRGGLHIHEAVLDPGLEPNTNDTVKATQLYRYVTGKIESTGSEWAASAAEDTLLSQQGSRTTALLALAHASGLNASLLMARKIDRPCPRPTDYSCYTEPLVRFWFANGEVVDADAESDDLPLGAVPPSFDTRDALLVPLTLDDTKKPEIVFLANRSAHEKSAAEGDLWFREGDLEARVQMRLGTARAQEVRSMLRNAGERERQAFFEQLAMRIFPGAITVTGKAVNESDPERPLELTLSCTVPQFISRQGGAIDFDQLAPALGLRTLYAKTASRQFPLFIDSVLFESTVFHVHLPEGISVHSLPADFTSRNEFGEYILKFTRGAGRIDVHRDFHIPMQVIAAEKYPAFADFARRIDEAEKQRLSLEPGNPASALPKSGPQQLSLK